MPLASGFGSSASGIYLGGQDYQCRIDVDSGLGLHAFETEAISLN